MSADAPRPHPVILGEVLFDRFPDGRSVLGGAPLNVAWHLQALGAEPLLITAVGADREGGQVLAAMAAWGLDTRGVQVVTGCATGEVRVWLEGRSPRFEIPSDQAWDHLRVDQLPPLPPVPGGLLYHGTLMLRGAGNRSLVDGLARERGLPVFLDINLRPPWWSPDRVAGAMRNARWIKLNEEELDQLAPETAGGRPEQRAAELRERTGAEAVFLTLGAAGAVLSTGDETLEAPALEVEVVDTVGAGDAFSAAAILGLLRGWAAARTLERALGLAAAVCGVPGATPTRRDIYRRITADWA